MTQILSLVGAITGLVTAVIVGLISIRVAQQTAPGRRAVDDIFDTAFWLRHLGAGPSSGGRSFPFSSRFLHLAVRRLPSSMTAAERERWEEEMAADLASVGGPLRRLLFALRLWCKGAPGLRAAADPAPRSASD